MIISHAPTNPVQVDEIKEHIKKIKNPILPHEVELELVEQLNQFPLGQFLLGNKGLNVYWTAYVILHVLKKVDLHHLERWLVNYAPGFIATQQRFQIFQRELQKLIFNGCHLASVPCGLMDDLLTLDYSMCNDCHLTGIDLDPESIELAAQNAKDHNINNVSFTQKNAWDLGLNTEFDVITSNGLNIYEQDNNSVVDLYKQFYSALNSRGYLVTSFITPPPSPGVSSNWKLKSQEDSIKQLAIFSDILQAGWQCYRTEDESREQLQAAGFKVIKVVYDSQNIFPTILAEKQC